MANRSLLNALLFALAFVVAGATVLHAEDNKAHHLLTICEKSCSQRGGIYTFQVFGDRFNPDSDLYKCTCGDEVKQPVRVIRRVTANEK